MLPRSDRLSHPRVAARTRDGFALLVTIVLVAFLVLLLVGLATFTRVETRVADNAQQLGLARSNALFSLNLAIGQLQRHAGPDRRVTARADIDAANLGNPFWTGVWSAEPTDPANPSHAAAPASAAPLAWLVSGNEANGTATNPASPAVAVPDTGNDNVWLLRHAMGVDLSDTAVVPSDLGVRLAKQAILAPASSVPGRSATDPDVRIGSYAWWIGDEGIKAKVSMDDPYRASPANSNEAVWRRESAPRPGLELLSANALSTVFTNPTDAFESSRSRVLAQDQIAMLAPSLADDAGRIALGSAFHDLTTHGQGVLADTMRGGLRRDLTRGLASSPPAGSIADTEIGDGAAVLDLPAPGGYGRTTKLPVSMVWTPNAEPHAPTWDQVRAWVGIRAPSGGGAMDPVGAALANVVRDGVTCPATAGHAVMPVVAMLELGYGLDVDSDSQYRVMLRPRVVLLNPYNVPLGRAAYSVTYQSSVSSNSDLTFTMSMTAADSPTGAAVSDSQTGFYLTRPTGGLIAANPVAGTRFLAFNITDSFEPGEVRVYSLPASAAADIQANSGVLDLEPGLSTVRGYLATGVTAPSWYDPSMRDRINVTWAKIPADHPRISIALGATNTATVATPSIIARYIQTSSSHIYGLSSGSNPVAKLASDQSRQLRTIRFSLRNATLDLLSHGNGNMSSEGEIGGDLPADSSSGGRFLVDNNPRAIVSQRIGGRDSVAHYAISSFKSSSYTEIDTDGVNAFWGGSSGDDGHGSTHVALFDVLRQGEELVSIGRLGQVNWGVDGKHPAYPLGNSFASVFYPAGSPDFGYALNEALWDRFFFSTLPVALAPRPARLPNARMRFYDPTGATDVSMLAGMNGYQLAASRLLIDGAFNINSTSVEAWAAFLGGAQAADYVRRDRTGARTDASVRAFPRLRGLHDSDPTDQPGKMYEWTGYRNLSDAELKPLASRIVAAIKARGRPARSLAEFLNRDLSRPSSSTRNQMGVVQAAIDATINTDTPGSGGGDLSDLPALNLAKTVPASFSLGDNPDAARGKLRSAGAPGFLLQNDLLTPLAPAMSARSDTFRVRAYGESINPATGDIQGRAWCEAVVQRLPDFVGGEPAELRIDDAALGASSQTFGRKFVVTFFRWLGPDDI